MKGGARRKDMSAATALLAGVVAVAGLDEEVLSGER